MKKVIFVIISIVLYGCSKNEVIENPDVTPPSDIEKIISELKIKPSNEKDITYIGLIIDSISYKIVGGKMNNNAWLAKFDANGKEIFSYQFKDNYNEMKNSYVTFNAIKFLDKNVLSFVVWVTDYPNPPPTISDSYNMNFVSRLCVIDFNTGKELHKFSFVKNDEYKATKTFYSYFIESYLSPVNIGGSGIVSNIYSVSLDGKKYWERKLNEKENSDLYKHAPFIDDENVVLFKSKEAVYNLTVYSYKYISFNIKNSSINFEFEVLLIGDHYTEDNIVYDADKIYVVDNIIKIEYNEYKRSISIKSDYGFDYTLLNRYYYEIDKYSGKIIIHSKI